MAEKSVLLLMRALRDLRAGHPTEMEDAPLQSPHPPSRAEAMRHLGRFLRAGLQRVMESRRERAGRGRENWRLAVGKGRVDELTPASAKEVEGTYPIMADPFLFRESGRVWVFFEAMNADGGNGWIEVAELVDGKLKSPQIALKRPYHLSYPFVFEDRDHIFMLPETQSTQQLEVWRAKTFPTEWELHATGFEGQHLAESSLFKSDNGTWWLLTNLSDHHAFQEHSSELYLYSVDGPGLENPRPHPGNPVVIGSGTARNAGAVIRQNGRLYRPSQNNSHGVYGYGLNISEITRLDEEGYAEELLRQFTPEDLPGSNGLHHLSTLDDLFVIDWRGQGA